MWVKNHTTDFLSKKEMEFLRILLNIFDFVHFRLNLIFTSIFFEQFRIWVLTVPYLGFNNSNRFLKEFVCYVMKGNIRNIENIPSKKTWIDKKRLFSNELAKLHTLFFFIQKCIHNSPSKFEAKNRRIAFKW